MAGAGGWIPRLGAAKGLPSWLSQQDLDYVVGQFESAGFRGGVNYYRNFKGNWQRGADREDFRIRVPTLFLAGSRDGVIGGATENTLREVMSPLVPKLRAVTLVPEIGHWIQQEAPAETNAALVAFLSSL